MNTDADSITIMGNLRILLIEDEVEMAELYERMLERLVAAFPGATISKVETREDALAVIRGLAPDVAVLDLVLKDASADETISEIRAISAKCPVVVVTGSSNPDVRKRSMESGAHSFIHKLDLVKEPDLLERAVVAAISAFKRERRDGLSREIEALRKFATKHGPETN